MEFRICSFNIGAAAKRCMRYTEENLFDIALAVKESECDIACLQEVDLGCARSDGVDMPRVISENSGYPFYHFIRIRPFQGGLYGTLILSKHRIISAKTGDFKVKKATQGTSYGYAVIRMGTEEITVFNTHLSIESAECNIETMQCLCDELKSRGGEYICCGDFNALPKQVHMGIPHLEYANKELCTYSDRGIDNVLYTQGFELLRVWVKDTTASGTSDHNMLLCDFKKNY